MMRSLLVGAAALMITATGASAQMLSAGAGILFKGGLNGGEIPNGFKTDPNFNPMPDISAMGLLRFSKTSDMGVMLEIGTAEYTFRMRPENESFANESNTLVVTYPRFAVTPSLYLGGFTLGASFGFGSTATSKSLDGKLELSADEGDVKSLTTELRIGGLIPLWKHPDGVLNLNLSAGYMLSGTDDTTGDTNPKPISAGIGISYLFTIIR